MYDVASGLHRWRCWPKTCQQIKGYCEKTSGDMALVLWTILQLVYSEQGGQIYAFINCHSIIKFLYLKLIVIIICAESNRGCPVHLTSDEYKH